MHLSAAERDLLREAFACFDLDGSSTLAPGELDGVFRLLGLGEISADVRDRWLRQLDSSRDDRELNFEQFVRLYMECKAQNTLTLEAAVAVMQKRPLDRTPAELHKLANYLASSVPFFAHLSRPMLEEMCRSVEVTQYRSGQWLWEQQVTNGTGGPLDAVHCMLEGAVSLWQHPALIRRSQTLAQRSARLQSALSRAPTMSTLPQSRSLRSPSPDTQPPTPTDTQHPQRDTSLTAETSARFNPIVTPMTPQSPAGRAMSTRRVTIDVHSSGAGGGGSAAVVGGGPNSPVGSPKAVTKGSLRRNPSSHAGSRAGTLKRPTLRFQDDEDTTSSTEPPMVVTKAPALATRFRTAARAVTIMQRATAAVATVDFTPTLSAQEPPLPTQDTDAGPSVVDAGHSDSLIAGLTDDLAMEPAPAPASRARELWRKVYMAVKFFGRIAASGDAFGGLGKRRTHVPRAAPAVVASLVADGCVSAIASMEHVPLSTLTTLHDVANRIEIPESDDEDDDLAAEIARAARAASMSSRVAAALDAAAAASCGGAAGAGGPLRSARSARFVDLLSRANSFYTPPNNHDSDDDSACSENDDMRSMHSHVSKVSRVSRAPSCKSLRTAKSIGGQSAHAMTSRKSLGHTLGLTVTIPGHESDDDTHEGVNTAPTTPLQAGLNRSKSLKSVASQKSLGRSQSIAVSRKKTSYETPVFVGFCQAGGWLNEQALLPVLGAPEGKVMSVGALAASFVTVAVVRKEAFAAALRACTGSLTGVPSKGVPGAAGTAMASSIRRGAFSVERLMQLADKPAGNRSACDDATLCHYLEQVPSFKELPWELRLQLSRALLPQSYNRGELIVRQGDVPHAMYVIVGGSVGVFRDSSPPPKSARATRLGFTSPCTTERVGPHPGSLQHTARSGAVSAAGAGAAATSDAPSASSTTTTTGQALPLPSPRSSVRGTPTGSLARGAVGATSSKARMSQTGSRSGIARVSCNGSAAPMPTAETVQAPTDTVVHEGPNVQQYECSTTKGGSVMEEIAKSVINTTPDAVVVGESTPLSPTRDVVTDILQLASRALYKGESMSEARSRRMSRSGSVGGAAGAARPQSAPLAADATAADSTGAGSSNTDSLAALDHTHGAVAQPQSRRQSQAGDLPLPIPASLSTRPAHRLSMSGAPGPGGLGLPSDAVSASGVGGGATSRRQSMSGSAGGGGKQGSPTAAAAATAAVTRGGRSLVPSLSRLSASVHERRAVMATDRVNTAAAMRSKHAAVATARASSAVGAAQAIAVTEGHAGAASRVAALMLGERAGADDAVGGGNHASQIEELESTLGPLQQLLGPMQAVGEQELIDMPKPGASGPSATDTEVKTFVPEMAHMKRRETSALALQECHLLQIESTVYRESLLEWRRRQLVERLAFLHKLSCFKGLRQQALMSIDNSLQWLEVPRGTVLQYRGAPMQGLLLIQHGTLGVYHAPTRTTAQRVLDTYDAAVARIAAGDDDWAAAAGPDTAAGAALDGRPATAPGPLASSLSVAAPRLSVAPGAMMSARTSHAGQQSLSGAPVGLGRGPLVSGSGALKAGARGTSASGAKAAQRHNKDTAMRLVSYLGADDVAGEDGLVTGSHQVTLVAETAVKVAILRSGDMTILEDKGIARLVDMARMREDLRAKQAEKGPDQWPKVLDDPVLTPGLLTGTSTQTGPVDSAASSGGWAQQGTGLAMALAAVRRRGPGPATRPATSRDPSAARGASVLGETGQSAAAKGAGHALDLGVYAQWFHSVAKQAAEDALEAARANPTNNPTTTESPQGSSPYTNTTTTSKHSNSYNDKSSASTPSQLIGTGCVLTGWSPAITDTYQPSPACIASHSKATSGHALCVGEPSLGRTVEASEGQQDVAGSGAVTKPSQRALDLLQGARGVLVQGLHRAPAHVGMEGLRALPRPPELHAMLTEAHPQTDRQQDDAALQATEDKNAASSPGRATKKPDGMEASTIPRDPNAHTALQAAGAEASSSPCMPGQSDGSLFGSGEHEPTSGGTSPFTQQAAGRAGEEYRGGNAAGISTTDDQAGPGDSAARMSDKGEASEPQHAEHATQRGQGQDVASVPPVMRPAPTDGECNQEQAPHGHRGVAWAVATESQDHSPRDPSALLINRYSMMTSASQWPHRQSHAALHASPLIPQRPGSVFTNTSCLALCNEFIPGVLSQTVAGKGEGADTDVCIEAFRDRDTVRRIRAAKPHWQVGKMQAQLHRQALNTVLALTQPKKAKQAQTQSQKQSDMGGLVRDIVAANPSLLYAAEQGRGASQVVGSLNSGWHYSSAALTSSRWHDMHRTGSQAAQRTSAILTRTEALGQANEAAAAALGIAW